MRKKDGDKTWRLMFVYNKNNKLQTKVAFVSTYKADETTYKIEAEPTRITLSVKTASLLAIIILNKLNQISINMNPPVVLLSPLAGSVFSKDDIAKISANTGATHYKTVKVINASCQSGGHYLADSRLHTAAVAAIVATRAIKDKKMKDAIIGKTIKQYLSVKKVFEPRLFEIYAEFGHGGVPSTLSPDNLVKLFDEIQKITPIQASMAARVTKRQVQVVAPSALLLECTPVRREPETPEAGPSGVEGAGAIPKGTRPPSPL